MHTNIENKVAVVTGASRGIGYSIAQALLENGASVVIGSRNEKEIEAAAEALRSHSGGHVAAAPMDVRDYKQVERFIASAEREFGGIDILVNNAGIGLFSPVDELAPEQWDAVIQTNLSGPFYCIRAAVPVMKRRGGGYIFNISSLAGKNAFAGGAAYNASKFGLNGFSEAAMLDLRYENIRVSYIMPGTVETSFGRSGAANKTSSWKIGSQDVAQVVIDLLRSDPRVMLSRVEMRPSKPPR
ncbi:MAG: SDR family oxidoreductase [Acidobacteria bacterium]|nr:SDR family oxidoreductase [Acidobacteriota bacterium]